MRRFLLPLACTLLVAVAAPLVHAGRPAAQHEPVQGGVVDHIADGDTFTLRDGDRVRIVGIDSSEEYFGKHQCGSKQAAALLTRLIPAGTHVTLRRDEIQPNRDSYGRLLRYIGRAGIADVGLAMIESGWAGAYPYGDGNTREHEYSEAAQRAKGRAAGAWGLCRPLPPAFTHPQ
jgi:micrococcal nuclease